MTAVAFEAERWYADKGRRVVATLLPGARGRFTYCARLKRERAAAAFLERPIASELLPAVAAATTRRDGRERWLDPALEILGGTVAAIAPEERLCSAEQTPRCGCAR